MWIMDKAMLIVIIKEQWAMWKEQEDCNVVAYMEMLKTYLNVVGGAMIYHFVFIFIY